MTSPRPKIKYSKAKGAKNGEVAQLERRKIVAEQYLLGKSQIEIAVLVGVTQACVSLDLKWIQEQWLAKGLQDFNLARATEVAKIDNLERVAWENFELTTFKDVVTKAKSKDEYDTVERVRKAGDDRFLNRISWCIEMRTKLLGLAQEKTATNNVFVINWDDMTKREDNPTSTVQARIAQIVESAEVK